MLRYYRVYHSTITSTQVIVHCHVWLPVNLGFSLTRKLHANGSKSYTPKIGWFDWGPKNDPRICSFVKASCWVAIPVKMSWLLFDVSILLVYVPHSYDLIMGCQGDLLPEKLIFLSDPKLLNRVKSIHTMIYPRYIYMYIYIHLSPIQHFWPVCVIQINQPSSMISHHFQG